MKLVDRSVRGFCDILASNAPAPGGGSAAALEGALGCALIGMVASLTIGRKKYAEHECFMEDCAGRSEELRQQFLDIVDRDTEAFNGVSAVFAMPNGTDGEKAGRKEAMQAALMACTLPPFEVMECALSALGIIREMLGRFNTSAASDLGVAALSLKAAAGGAWLNVQINLIGIKDETFAGRFRAEGEAILKKTITISDSIYDSISDSFRQQST